MRNKILGAGMILIGGFLGLIALSILFADHSYLSQFRRKAWIALMLRELYGQFSTRMEAWLIFCIAAVFVYLGIHEVKSKPVAATVSATRGLVLSRLRKRVSRKK